MKAPIVSRQVGTATLFGFFASASASAHPGHYGHGVEPSPTTGFLQDLPSLGPLSLALVITCLALFFIRSTYRKLP